MEEPTIFGLSVSNTVLPVALLALGAAFTLLVNIVLRRKDATRLELANVIAERKDYQERVRELETQLRLLKDSVQPISMAFQQILIKELTHFHEKRTDELLEKIGPPYMLSDAEEKELVDALEKRVADAGNLMTESEIDAAKMLPMLIKRVKAELAMGIPPVETELKVVVVPATDSGK